MKKNLFLIALLVVLGIIIALSVLAIVTYYSNIVQ